MRSHGSSHGTSLTESVGGSIGTSHTEGYAEARSRSRATSTNETAGSSTREALIPIYSDLPTSFHSKESELYFAGEAIRGLAVGECFVRIGNVVKRLRILPPAR